MMLQFYLFRAEKVRHIFSQIVLVANPHYNNYCTFIAIALYVRKSILGY